MFGVNFSASAAGRLTGAAIVAAISIGAANAADMPVKAKAPLPVVTDPWSGIYIGLGAGFRSTNTESAVTNFLNGGLPALDCTAVAFFGGCITGESLNDTAFRLGPYVGWNWQFSPQWLVGIEGDFGLAKKSTTLGGFRYPATLLMGIGNESFGITAGWDASVRGRLGFVADPSVLLYVTGGPAWMRIKSTSSCGTLINQDCTATALNPPGPAVITHATTKLGWTAGGGIEAMLGGNLVGRVEYRYSDFGTVTNTDFRTIGAGQLVTYDLRVRAHMGTLGLAYKFGGASAASAAMASAGFERKAPAVVSSWSGPYLGLGVGARAATTDPIVTGWTQFGVNRLLACTAGIFGCANGEPLNNTAFRFSPYAGYNWQFSPKMLVGIEVDFGFAKKKATLNGALYPISDTFYSLSNATNFSVETGWDASLRGRVGFLPKPSVLAYVTGGPAWMRVSATSSCFLVINAPCRVNVAPNDFGLPATITNTTTKLGWTAGAGIEGKLWGNWIARGEYRYADFGTISNTDTRVGPVTGNTQVVSYDLRVRTHMVTLGLAYLLDWNH